MSSGGGKKDAVSRAMECIGDGDCSGLVDADCGRVLHGEVLRLRALNAEIMTVLANLGAAVAHDDPPALNRSARLWDAMQKAAAAREGAVEKAMNCLSVSEGELCLSCESPDGSGYQNCPAILASEVLSLRSKLESVHKEWEQGLGFWRTQAQAWQHKYQAAEQSLSMEKAAREKAASAEKDAWAYSKVANTSLTAARSELAQVGAIARLEKERVKVMGEEHTALQARLTRAEAVVEAVGDARAWLWAWHREDHVARAIIVAYDTLAAHREGDGGKHGE